MLHMNVTGSKSYKRIYISVISLLLTVMILFSLFFYSKFIKRQQEDIWLQAQERLERIESAMSVHYQDMMRIVLQINTDGVFSYAQIASKTQREALLEELMRYVQSNSFWKDMSYESMLDEESVYSSQGIFEKDIYEKYIYDTSDSFDLQDFQDRRQYWTFASIPAGQIISRQYPQVMMAYVFGLPMMSEEPKRLITFYIEKSTVDHLVEQFLPCEVENVCFYEQGALVYSLYETNHAAQDAIRFSCEGNSGQYIYEMFIDPDVLYADYHATQLFFFLTLGVMCVVIFLSSWMVALYNYQPLHQLVSKYAKERHEKLDEYALLNELVEDTIAQKREIQKKLFVSNLVWGQYESLENLQSDAQEAGITFEYPEFVCCALAYEGEADSEFCDRICEELDTTDTMAVCAKRDGGHRLTVIVNYFGTEENHRLVERVLRGLEGVHVGMGTQAHDLMHLSASYQHARHAMHEAMEKQEPFRRYQEDSELKARTEKEEKAKAKADMTPALLESILQCMQTHLSDTSMSLEFIAGQCNISASYLVRYFKSSMNITPMQYVDSLRMEIARRLLTTTTQSLRQIVEQCGYLDESNFARKFKKQEGITPMNYRKTHWKSEDEHIQSLAKYQN